MRSKYEGRPTPLFEFYEKWNPKPNITEYIIGFNEHPHSEGLTFPDELHIRESGGVFRAEYSGGGGKTTLSTNIVGPNVITISNIPLYSYSQLHAFLSHQVTATFNLNTNQVSNMHVQPSGSLAPVLTCCSCLEAGFA
jgi:hypothetical protein